MPYMIRKRTDGRQDLMRDGVGHESPLRVVGPGVFTFFNILPGGVVASDDPVCEVHEVKSEAEANAMAKKLGATVEERKHTKPKPVDPPKDPDPKDDRIAKLEKLFAAASAKIEALEAELAKLAPSKKAPARKKKG